MVEVTGARGILMGVVRAEEQRDSALYLGDALEVDGVVHSIPNSRWVQILMMMRWWIAVTVASSEARN